MPHTSARSGSARPPRVALLGFADVNNYGDKFFPRIGSSELSKRLPDASITLFSPTGATVDGVEYQAYERDAIQGEFDAAILLGGEVVHPLGHMLRDIYERLGVPQPTVDPIDTVFDWASLDIGYKAWVAVGSPVTSPPSVSQKLAATVPHLDRLAVRGLLSKQAIERYVGNQMGIEVVPDIGWLISTHLGDARDTWRTIAARASIDSPDTPFLVFETFDACLPPSDSVASIADSLKRIQANTGLRIVLLPICTCWRDWQTLSDIQKASDGAFSLIPRGLSTAETASVLLNASLYVGSSLHGAITCLSAGIPSGVVYGQVESKFTELFGSQMRLDALVRDWDELEDLAFRLTRERRATLVSYAEAMRHRLGDLFDSVASEIGVASSDTGRSTPSARQVRLRAKECRAIRDSIAGSNRQLGATILDETATTTGLERSLPVVQKRAAGDTRLEWVVNAVTFLLPTIRACRRTVARLRSRHAKQLQAPTLPGPQADSSVRENAGDTQLSLQHRVGRTQAGAKDREANDSVWRPAV